uniref:Tub domain-containing protein n=1 Tax=Macrostomum lignano TaxID=282301 RepID=A0A1I8FRI0_9PLAT
RRGPAVVGRGQLDNDGGDARGLQSSAVHRAESEAALSGYRRGQIGASATRAAAINKASSNQVPVLGGFLTDAMFNRRSKLIGNSRGGKDCQADEALEVQLHLAFPVWRRLLASAARCIIVTRTRAAGQSYPLCQLMPAGSRLLLYKSSRATGSPSLTLLLAGYTAIYVERESSANHVSITTDDGAMLSAEASAAASAAAHSRQHSGGFMRRLRSSFAPAARIDGINARRRLRAAAAEADAALGTDDCLVESDAEARLGGQGRWLRCRARLRRGGRLCLPGVAAEPILPGRSDQPAAIEPAAIAGSRRDQLKLWLPARFVRRRQKRNGVDGQACANTSGLRRWCSFNYRSRTQRPRQTGPRRMDQAHGLSNRMAPQYEPMQTELLDLHSARALVDSRRRASMPERQLNCLTDLVSAAAASGRAPRPLPPLPDNSITSGYGLGGNTAESGCAVQPAAPYYPQLLCQLQSGTKAAY